MNNAVETSTMPPPIPILLTVRELHHGGIENDVTKLAIHLDRSRFEPHVATYQTEGMRFEELQQAGIPVLRLPVSSLASFSALSAANCLRRYIREHGIRLVHSFDPSAVFVLPIARALRVPAVLCSTLGHRDLLNGRTRRQLRWIDKIVDTVVVNCEALRAHMMNDECFRPADIAICHNGVNTSVFHPAAQFADSSDASDAPFVIGTVCVLRPEKDIGLLQQAFARIRHLIPRAKLQIVGSGPELLRLQELSAHLGIEGTCEFLPSTRQVPEVLRSFDIFVLCSTSEGFSNALLEAMACGCCVVGSRVGGTPEMIGNDERGLLFRSGDAGDLAEKLARLIGNAELRRDLANRAASFTRQNLSIEAATRRMTTIYLATLRRKTMGLQN